jgi:hydroxyethylthiazole kinase-like uncharacterized protein yjeF
MGWNRLGTLHKMGAKRHRNVQWTENGKAVALPAACRLGIVPRKQQMIELLTPSEMARADRLAIERGTPGWELMRRAGRAVADAVSRRPLGSRILVICGTGNNGGDGFVAASLLKERGYPVRVALLGSRAGISGDAAQAAAGWPGQVEDAGAVDPSECDVIVDALLGAGIDRDVTGALAALIERVNASGRPVVAVDLPSGVDGATGLVRGVAVAASETMTFFRRKPGHLLLPGRLRCGPVRVAEIGIPDAVLAEIRPATSANSPLSWKAALPRPGIDSHKYRRGHAVVLSGRLEATGAARLAARSALRIGAGLVTVASPSSALIVNASALEAVMVRRADGAEGLAELLKDDRLNVVVAGPGLEPDEETRLTVETILRLGRAVVLDAGALTAFREAPDRLFRATSRSPAPVVMTPHEGEFARLFPALAAKPSKLDRARAAAAAARAVVVLKGPDTVVAEPDGVTTINENAPPFLGTAGSGDVLAGMIGGLLAQAMPAFEAASCAVWMHGAAGARFGRGLIAEDLPDLIPDVFRELADATG